MCSAAFATNASWGVVYYVPDGVNKLTLDLSKLGGGAGSSEIYRFDPTNGTTKSVANSPFANASSQTFTTPGTNRAGSADWVLVAEIIGESK
jgi:hypothetical protein